MTIATREQIMDALLAVLRNNAGVAAAFPTISRRFLMWERVIQSQQDAQPLYQPALFLYDGVGLGGGIDTYEHNSRSTPARVILRRTIVIYARLPGGGTPSGPDSSTPGGTLFDPLIEVVIAALAPDDASQNVLTLGGLVSHCYLKGNGLMMTGEIDPTYGQGMVTLPIEIMMYPSL